MCEYDQTSDKNNPITFRKFGPMDYGIRYQGIFTCSFQFWEISPLYALINHLYAYLLLENEFPFFFLFRKISRDTNSG